jgi:hypothetical protein
MKKLSIFNIHLERKPSKISFNGAELVDSKDFQYDMQKMRLTAKISNAVDGTLVVLK